MALHIGILIYLSPLFRGHNYSVFPWNLASAAIGFWVLWKADSRDWFTGRNDSLANDEQLPTPVTTKAPALPQSPPNRQKLFERIAFALMMIVPMGFYVDWLDHGYAHVLYSDSIPRGMISRNDGSLLEIRAWGELAIPFPNERRLLKQHFVCVGQPGEKLHVRDPRLWLDDLYFQMNEDGPVDISRQAFFAADDGSVGGVELDSVRAIYLLDRAGTIFLKRDKESMVWAIQFSPEKFETKLLKHLNGVSNVEEVVLDDIDFTDADLKSFPPLPKLVGLGLSRTKITDQGIEQLIIDRHRKYPRLEFIVTEGTNVSDLELLKFHGSR